MLSAELREVCSRMVDPRLGIVRRVSLVPLQPGEPPLYIYAASCARPKYFLRNDVPRAPEVDYTVPANGVALEEEPALWSALGEAAERYAAGIHPTELLVSASREELGSQALEVEKLIGFSDRQYARADFRFARFDPRARIRWIGGCNLTRGTPCLVPAALVYLGYGAVSPAECFYPAVSSGMAAGRSLEQALANGLLELVERDAFMCAWLLAHAPRAIRPESLADALTERERRLLASPGMRLTLLDITTDLGLPSVLALLQPRGGGSVVVGAAADLGLHRAAMRAVIEAFHTLNWSIVLGRTPRSVLREAVRDLEDHVRYYLDERNFPAFAPLLRLRPQDAEPDGGPVCLPAVRLQQALERLRVAGLEACYVETTTADLRAVGFRTVRVLVPGLHPLNVGFDTVHEDDRRLRRVAEYWGIAMPARLNPEPHPFP